MFTSLRGIQSQRLLFNSITLHNALTAENRKTNFIAQIEINRTVVANNYIKLK